MKKNESKYFYTASLMNQALLSLLEKKDIEYISVTEITKKAGVNRSTFYLHYDSIYDLLEETIDNLNKQFISSFNTQKPLKMLAKEDAFFITDERIKPYLLFVKENKRVLKLINQKPQLFNSKTVYKKMYDEFFYPAISLFIKEENDRIYKLEFYTAGVVAIIHKWLDLDCSTDIDDLVKLIKTCVNYNV